MRQSFFIGRVQAKPELRHTQGGTPVLNLEILVIERQGESWHKHRFRLNVFGQQAERIARQANAGDEVVAFCKPESREYTDSQGKRRKSEDHTANWIRVCVGDESQDPNQGVDLG